MINEIEVQATDSSRMISIIDQAAQNPNVDPDKMQKLLDVQLTIMDRQAKIEFDEAMAACQAEMADLRIVKNATNDQTRSTYAKHEAICAGIKPVYTKHGFRLSFSEGKAEIESEIRINCTVTHNKGHSEHYWIDLPADNAGIKGNINKTPVHAKGSTFSYGRRYLTLMIYDLATYDDSDAYTEIEYITEEQAADIKALEEEVGADHGKFCQYMKVTAISDIRAKDLKKATSALESKRKKQ